MLNISELRLICKERLNVKPTFFGLLKASLDYDKKELEQLFYQCDTSLSVIRNVINDISEETGTEEILLEIIRKEAAPNSLHLLKYALKNNTNLLILLKNEGVNTDKLTKGIEDKILLNNNSKVFPDLNEINNPLMNISKIRYN